MFAVYSFEIERDRDRKRVDAAQFWEKVEENVAGLPEAYGCYIFSIPHGSNMTPWYVGMTEEKSFRNEVFNQINKNISIKP